eukprot:g4936.t1
MEEGKFLPGLEAKFNAKDVEDATVAQVCIDIGVCKAHLHRESLAQRHKREGEEFLKTNNDKDCDGKQTSSSLGFHRGRGGVCVASAYTTEEKGYSHRLSPKQVGDVASATRQSPPGGVGPFRHRSNCRSFYTGRSSARQIDLAVHCVKDLPTQLPPGIESFAVLERGEIEDAVVYHQKHKVHRLDALPARAVIGTSALRRRATLHRLHPHLVCKDVRGNVQTRLAKLDAGEYDAILLARTGLTRMGLQGRIHQVLDAKTYGHAVGQGALSCCIREKGGGNELVRSLLARLNHGATMLITCIERGMLNAVEGGCKVPIAVHSSIEDQADGSKFTVRCRVLSVDGQDQVEGQISMTVSSAALASPTAVREEAGRAWSVGQQLGKQLKEAGAIRILQPIRDAAPYAPAHVAPNKQARHT